MKYYAGIGSRETPVELKPRIEIIVNRLNQLDYTLRSGGAQGADSYFEEYANKKEIYLPWKGFNNNKSELFSVTPAAMKMAMEFHPRPDMLSRGALSLMARNGHQVLGADLKTPCEFIICWTKDGKELGGTAQAMRIARYYKIPIVNLFFQAHYESLMNRLSKL